MAQAFHPLTVAGVDRLCDDAAAVTFAVPAALAGDYAFRAGQWMTLRRTVERRDERRSYSICSPEGGALRIAARAIPGGLFSRWLVHDLRPGDRVDVGIPQGAFTPEGDITGHHVAIAAGSGITPVLSIAATLLRDPDVSMSLLYGNRRAATVMFADELADLKDRDPPRFELLHVLSREARDVEAFTGRLDAAKLTALLRLLPPVEQVTHWWLCGPLGMVAGAQAVLAGAGVPAARVHVELFYVEEEPPVPARHEEPDVDGEASEVTVVLDGRSTTTTVPFDTPILDGGQRVRPDLPFSCKSAVCGTCRAKVTAGEVDMRRNFVLEPAEVDAGFVLTCQARPRSAAMTVDYDA